MKLPTSDKTASFGKKPKIKKGYYPAQLLSVEEFKDKDGNLREGKYGRQLIFEFGIFNTDENGKPTTPIEFTEEGTDKTTDVVLPKFVYHQYKDKKTGDFQTAITPNSAITGMLKSLGWEFSADGVDIEPLIGNWVEVNVDDFDAKAGDETYKASTIVGVNKYEGPTPGAVKAPVKKEPQAVKKTIKHKQVNDAKEESLEGEDKAEDIKAKIAEVKKLKDEGLMSEEGCKMAVEQLETRLEQVKK